MPVVTIDIDTFLKSADKKEARENLGVDKGSISIDLSGTITTGVKGAIYVEEETTIRGWSIGSPQTGSIEIKVLVCSAANYPPDTLDSINSSSLISLSSADNAISTDVSGWTDTVIPAGSYLAIEIVSISGLSQVHLDILTSK